MDREENAATKSVERMIFESSHFVSILNVYTIELERM